MTDPTITLRASELRDLLTPVLPLASRDVLLPVINTVLVETVGDHVTATATDRYRFGICRCKPETPPRWAFSALLARDDLQRVLKLYRPTRVDDPAIRLTLGDGRVTFEQTGVLHGLVGVSVTLMTVRGDYPRVRRLIGMALATTERASEVGLNPHFLADFRHAARGPGATLNVRLGAPGQPALVTCGDHFIGAIMPRVRGDDKAAPLPPVASWWDDYTADAEQVGAA